MNIIQAIILSIVEGVTEFLPISSTGHLVLASNLLNIPQTPFVKSFEIFIQLGAILAVFSLYWKTLFTQKNIWRTLFIAFLPTLVVGFLFYPVIKGFLIGNSFLTTLMLFLGGVLLIFIEYKYLASHKVRINLSTLSAQQSFLIGVVQSFSVVPGVSRAAATIFGGIFIGLSRKEAVLFSFLLAVPTMMAATGYDLFKSGFYFSMNEFTLLAIGFFGSFMTAYLTMKYFLRYIAHHTFIPFGVYRIVLAIAFWMYLFKWE
ncbi:undecaprenyl-diphosphate phosphatase [Candidatus Gottesmanbacteria bacterium]|nr:undecaprenyl-diphosphate phosphatase [Candidatus Gottesmanbacteria bacterium]